MTINPIIVAGLSFETRNKLDAVKDWYIAEMKKDENFDREAAVKYFNDNLAKFEFKEDIIFDKFIITEDDRKTVKQTTDKVIGGRWACNCDIYVEEYEKIDVPNPEYGKEEYCVIIKVKREGKKNYQRFWF